MATRKKSFKDAAAELLASRKPPCVICNHPERSDIEDLRAAGMPKMDIARILVSTGFIKSPPRIETVSGWVGEHFESHMNEE